MLVCPVKALGTRSQISRGRGKMAESSLRSLIKKVTSLRTTILVVEILFTFQKNKSTAAALEQTNEDVALLRLWQVQGSLKISELFQRTRREKKKKKATILNHHHVDSLFSFSLRSRGAILASTTFCGDKSRGRRKTKKKKWVSFGGLLFCCSSDPLRQQRPVKKPITQAH